MAGSKASPSAAASARHEFLGREIGGRDLAERCERAQIGVLRKVADGCAAGHGAIAMVGRDEARHHLEQRGLSRAVPADERDAVALLHDGVEAIEDRLAAVTEGDAGKLEQGRAGHSRELAAPLPLRKGLRAAAPAWPGWAGQPDRNSVAAETRCCQAGSCGSGTWFRLSRIISSASGMPDARTRACDAG